MLQECLSSLKKNSNDNVNHIIIVNDNKDVVLLKQTTEVCKEFDVIEIRPKIHKGSAAARNAGIKHVKGDIILFLDDDALIRPKYFENLTKHFEDEKVGAVGGAEIKKGGSFFHSVWFSLNRPGTITWSGDIVSNFSRNLPKAISVDHLQGSNFAIRKEIIDEIGLMNENLLHYRDETEYVYRVKKAGYKVIFEPKAAVVHKPLSSGGNLNPNKKKEWAYWYHKNTSYLFFKHVFTGNILQLVAFIVREFVYAIFRMIIYRNIFYLTNLVHILDGRNNTTK